MFINNMVRGLLMNKLKDLQMVVVSGKFELQSGDSILHKGNYTDMELFIDFMLEARQITYAQWKELDKRLKANKYLKF